MRLAGMEKSQRAFANHRHSCWHYFTGSVCTTGAISKPGLAFHLAWSGPAMYTSLCKDLAVISIFFGIRARGRVEVERKKGEAPLMAIYSSDQ